LTIKITTFRYEKQRKERKEKKRREKEASNAQQINIIKSDQLPSTSVPFESKEPEVPNEPLKFKFNKNGADKRVESIEKKDESEKKGKNNKNFYY
jgi:hypothetical protein